MSRVHPAADDLRLVVGTDEAPIDPAPRLDHRLTSSAGLLVARQIVGYGLTAASSMYVVRALGPEQLAQYAVGITVYTMLLGVTDFGFAQLLARAMARGEGHVGLVARRIVGLNLMWSLGIGLAALAGGLVWSTMDVSGLVLVTLVPAIAVSGLTCLRQICHWRYAVGPLALVDIGVAGSQAAGLVLLVALGAPVPALAAVTTGCMLFGAVATFRIAWRLLPPVPAGESKPRRLSLLKAALPLGAALFVPTAYAHADLLLLSSLLPDADVGRYAAAYKFFSLLAILPTVVMSFALPHLSVAGRDRRELAAITAQMSHWFAAFLLPVTVLLGSFAPFVVITIYGEQFAGSAQPLRILMLAAAVSLLANIVGSVMVADGRVRWLLGQNLVALVINVGGNLLLIPRAGIVAAAILTLVTEVVVTGGSMIALRNRLDFAGLFRVAAAPLAACAPVLVLGAVWGHHLLPAVVAALVYLATVTLLHGWPPDVVARLTRAKPGGAARA